jgi:hypothetical protein
MHNHNPRQKARDDHRDCHHQHRTQEQVWSNEIDHQGINQTPEQGDLRIEGALEGWDIGSLAVFWVLERTTAMF